MDSVDRILLGRVSYAMLAGEGPPLFRDLRGPERMCRIRTESLDWRGVVITYVPEGR